AATKASGKAKAKLYIYRLDTKLWQKGEGTGEIENPTELAQEIRLGQWGNTEQLQGLYAASAMYNKVLTQAEVEELATASTLQAWLKKGPVGMWMFNQTSTAQTGLDITGNGADQTELVGTTVENVEPPIPYYRATVPLQASSGVAGGSGVSLTAPTTLLLSPAAGSATSTLKLRATTAIPLSSSKGATTATLSLRVRKVLKRLRVREKPPMRQYMLATVPGGRTYRWGEDEIAPDQAIEDLSDSDAVPGGYKELSGSLARRPSVDYGDMQRGTRIELFGAGQMKLGEYRLQQAPQTSGDKIVMDPAAVGYQANLSDDESAREIFRDVDLGSWQEASARRRATAPERFGGTSEILPAGDPNGSNARPALMHSFTEMAAGTDAVENWYDANGIELGRVDHRYVNVKNMTPSANWLTRIVANTDDISTSWSIVHEHNAASSVAEVDVDLIPAGMRWLQIYHGYTGEVTGAVDTQAQWRNIAVYGRHGLTVRNSSTPEAGLLASDVIAYAIAKWAPQLTFSTGSRGTIRPTGFPIPHLVFKDSTTVADMIDQANRFELSEWAVWHGQEGPTFYLNPRGEREGRKRWRARVRPAQLKETGPSMDRVFNGVLVQYPDVDGTQKVVAPTGSGYAVTSSALIDEDPLNPANQVPGLRRWTKIAMNSVATRLGAIETGKRFLEQTKLLDGSGEATLNGYVEDDHGLFWPYYCVRSGDLIEFVDSSIPGDRYIVSASRSRSSRSVTISLDAPPDSMEALLERLGVQLMARGLGS
ncbi:MAG TPA: hypothetical protein VGV69_05980, partial [Solirubrobacterales bacterium]|nr:hypothetical protein [Solirubrobacterales bacterium]